MLEVKLWKLKLFSIDRSAEITAIAKRFSKFRMNNERDVSSSKNEFGCLKGSVERRHKHYLDFIESVVMFNIMALLHTKW